MADSTQIKDVRKKVEALFERRDENNYRWQLLSRFILPSRGIFGAETGTVQSIMDARNENIVTRQATTALVKSAAGFTSSMTPESSPWVRWGFRDKTLEERFGVRAWLDGVQDLVATVLKESGFYQAIFVANMELLSFGCMMMMQDASPRSVCNFSTPMGGTYAVALDPEGYLSAVARVIRYTPHQLAEKFGEENLSAGLKTKLKDKPYTPVDIIHFVDERDNWNPEKLDARSMRYRSIFFEYDESSEHLLHEGGYNEMPYTFTNWDDGLSEYGVGPGDTALPDVMQLQEMETQILIAAGKMADPPMRVPTGFKQTLDTSAGSQVPMSASLPQEAIRPLYEMSSNITPLYTKTQELVSRINDSLLTSIFTDMPLELRPADMSATEYMERKRERLQQMGPNIAIYEPRILAPILNRTYAMLDRMGMIPDPPPIVRETMGSIIDFEYQSPLAQAMLQNKGIAVERFFLSLSQFAAVNPTVWDKVDIHQGIDEMARGMSIPGRVIRSDDEVEEIQAQRAAQEEQARQAEEEQRQINQLQQVGNIPAGPNSIMSKLNEAVSV